jgi:hypothetical protein
MGSREAIGRRKINGRPVWSLLATLALAWLAVCALAWLLQDRLIFFPGPAPSTTPARAGLAFEEVELTASDGLRSHGWWIPAPAPRGVAIVCHGNAGSIENRIQLAAALRETGLSVLLFDYRGYGASGGKPSERGLYLDAEAAYEHATGARGFDASRVIAYGESLGAAVAAELARRGEVGALVLESAFTSLADVGAKAYPFLPVRLLLRSRFDTRAKLAEVEAPVLLVHSPDDEIVPFAHSEGLRAAARGRVDLVATSGRHNDGGWLLSREDRDTVRAFVASALR